MTPGSILIAGIGNIFRGDDAFGVAVAHALMRREMPPQVRVLDCGTRALDLLYAILDGPATVILVDTARQGSPPGTLYKMEVDLEDLRGGTNFGTAAHGMNPLQVLRTAAQMGAAPRILLLACEPGDFGPKDLGRDGMTPAVEAALEPAVALMESMLTEQGVFNVSGDSRSNS